MRDQYGILQASIYIRLSDVREEIDVLKLSAGPLFLLSEAAILWKALKPAYMSISFEDGAIGMLRTECQWRIFTHPVTLISEDKDAACLSATR